MQAREVLKALVGNTHLLQNYPTIILITQTLVATNRQLLPQNLAANRESSEHRS
jgi:hypothetical protein